MLGADGPLGRDELIRVLDGARTSLEIALGGVLVALLIAVPVGSIAGYFGGATDAVVSRFTETIMAFPLLLFLVFATAKLSPSLRGVSYGWVLPIGRLLRGAPDRHLHVVLSDAARPRAAPDAAQRGVRRGRAT